MIYKIIAFFKNVNAALDYRANVNKTIKELSALSNKELNDIGIARGDIWSIAHDTYTAPKKLTARDVQEQRVNDNLKGWV